MRLRAQTSDSQREAMGISSRDRGNQQLPENQELRDFHARVAPRRIRVNLSFSQLETDHLEALARRDGLRLSTYLRRLVLRSAKVSSELAAGRAQVKRQGRGEAVFQFKSPGRKREKGSTRLERLATAMVSDREKGVPYYRTKAAGEFLSALPAGKAALAEKLMRELHRQPKLEEYRAAGVL